MTMYTVEPFLAGALLGYLGLIAVVLVLALFAEQKHKRLQALGQQLHDLAQTAVTRYNWAKDGNARDGWVVVDRTMQDLDAVVQEWEAIVYDDPTD